MPEMKQRMPVAQGAQMRQPAARPVRQQVNQQQQTQYSLPQPQQINAQQLAAVVGSAEAACMNKSRTQVVFQKQYQIVEVPVKYTMMYEKDVPVTIQMSPEYQIIQQPQAQVQLNSCIAQAPMVAPCDPCAEEAPCATGDCSRGPYSPGVYDAGYAAAALNAPYLAPNPYAYMPEAAYRGYY